MNSEEFNALHLGEYNVSDRDLALYARVGEYFESTDDVDFRVSENETRALKAWADDNGYSRGDLNRAKQIVNKYKL